MIESFRQHIKHFICSRPMLYQWWILLGDTGKKRLAASRRVEIVIEGYPRSANTYAVVAFQQAGNMDVSVAHHTHVPATILYGCQQGIPTVVLIRKPRDAVVSARIFSGKSTKSLIQEWIWFYQKCWPLREKFTVAMFDDVTGDFSKVIERINERYRTTFLNSLSGDYSSSVYEEIDMIAHGYGQGVDQVARPTKKREQLKAQVLQEVLREKNLLFVAEEIYERYRKIAYIAQRDVDTNPG